MNRREFMASSACGLAALLLDPSELMSSTEPFGVSVDPVILLPGPGGVGQLRLEPTQHRLTFWRDGARQWTFDEFGVGRFELNGPRSVVSDAAGRTFVANTGNDRITVLSSTGARVAEYGESGGELGQFRAPSGLAIGPDGLLYVSDTLNHRIQVMDPSTGRSVRAFGELRIDGTGLNGPGPIAFDQHAGGRLHVAERGSRRITIFSPRGSRIGTYGEGEMEVPRSLAIDANGTAYVADRNGVATFRPSDGGALSRFEPKVQGEPMLATSLSFRADGSLQVTGTVAHHPA